MNNNNESIMNIMSKILTTMFRKFKEVVLQPVMTKIDQNKELIMAVAMIPVVYAAQYSGKVHHATSIMQRYLPVMDFLLWSCIALGTIVVVKKLWLRIRNRVWRQQMPKDKTIAVALVQSGAGKTTIAKTMSIPGVGLIDIDDLNLPKVTEEEAARWTTKDWFRHNKLVDRLIDDKLPQMIMDKRRNEKVSRVLVLMHHNQGNNFLSNKKPIVGIVLSTERINQINTYDANHLPRIMTLNRQSIEAECKEKHVNIIVCDTPVAAKTGLARAINE